MLHRVWRVSAGLALVGWLALGAVAQAAGLPLWEASKGKEQIYLFGSVHVCNASCFPLPDAVLSRLERSSALVVELDPRQPDVQRRVLAAGSLPLGRTLEDELPAADWRLTERAAEQLGVPAESLKQLKPWLASTVLTMIAAQRAGYAATEGIDLAFLNLAGRYSLRVEELENASEQIAAFSAGTPAEQLEGYRLGMQQIESTNFAHYFDELVEAWRTGDEPGLLRFMNENLPAESSATKAFIHDRNVRMVSRLVKRMRDKRVRFVVVGVAHLIGPDGIPTLLAQRGYRVRQLTSED